MTQTIWHEIDHGTYSAIWANVNNDLVVFGSHTCMEGCYFHENKYVLTSWGFKDCEWPLIRSINDAGKWTYWIAEPRKDA